MTTPASLSVEGQIISHLAALKMQRTQFVRICESLSIPVSEALISLCLSGKRQFSQWTGLKLLELANELMALQSERGVPGVPLNWGVTEGIVTLLVQRRMQQAMEGE
jgi:hypothetical protein